MRPGISESVKSSPHYWKMRPRMSESVKSSPHFRVKHLGGQPIQHLNIQHLNN
ncbi:hypothetical protein [Bacillus alkalicola]|uniref:Uncharacterized protein n=1 Tax=Evansella alkalicola TaxID=745819 RepID=A0ABS6JWF0_9BACI|nr:hypothetical protein [Bacillus alkalicola]MBU9722919.1 hypothetical protein [Bacillus alkalicola]